MLDFVQAGKVAGVSTMIEMLEDLHEVGRTSRFMAKLSGGPLWELKHSSRGGEKGGSRVYLFLVSDEDAGIVNAEIKEPDAPTSREKLRVALAVAVAYKTGVPVFDEP
jgi:hypothetical protein